MLWDRIGGGGRVKFWLIVCTLVGGGFWYAIENHGGSSGELSLDEIDPSCKAIRTWEQSRIRGDDPIGLPAPNRERLIECIPSYGDKEYLIEEHFDYVDYLKNQ